MAPSRPGRGLSHSEDAYGQMLIGQMLHGDASEIIERDDGFIAPSRLGPAGYLARFSRWPALERRAMRFVRGRVLDLGCGGGRVCLHLQERGHEVVGIDVSPGAIEVCRMRGVRDARLLSIEGVDETLGVFDTIVMLGANLGLLGSEKAAIELLRRFHGMTSARGRIVGGSRDVHRSDDPVHVAYQARNRERGRMSGQIRMRVRFRDVATPWFDYLMLSPDELRGLAEPAGWRVGRILDAEDLYVAVLDKTASGRSGRR